MANKKIIVMRHGEKSGDALTAKGAMQAYAAATALGLTTRSTASTTAASTAPGRWRSSPRPRSHQGGTRPQQRAQLRGDHEDDLWRRRLGGVPGRAKVIKEKGGTVGVARVISPYAHEGGCVMTEAIGKIAYGLGNLQTALCISHSPWLELAAAATTPYCLGECDAVSYLVESDSLIVGSEIIRAPLSGQANV